MSNIFLRALELDDSKITVKWRNDSNVVNPLGGNIFYVSSLRESEWIKNEILNDSKNLRLAICLSISEIIGIVSLTRMDYLNRNAEFSIMIGEKTAWGKGFGSKATFLCLKHAFEELNMHRIYLTVREDNLSALAIYEKTGFVTEGIMRDAIYKNGRYINMISMSILKEDFIKKYGYPNVK